MRRGSQTGGIDFRPSVRLGDLHEIRFPPPTASIPTILAADRPFPRHRLSFDPGTIGEMSRDFESQMTSGGGSTIAN